MIQVEILAIKMSAAILAGVLVPLKDVVACELLFLARKVIKHQQHDDARNPDAKGNRGDSLSMGDALREIAPLFESVSLESTVVVTEHDLRMTLEEESQCAPRGADVHRLPQTVQDKHRLIQESAHCQENWRGR